MRFVLIVEFAQRVPDRSPPENSTSTASAFARLRTLSVSAFNSSREYIGALTLSAGYGCCQGSKGEGEVAFVPGSHRLVGGRTVDRRHGGSHRPQVGRELTTVMHKIEQEAPRTFEAARLHHFLAVEHERDLALPLRGRQRAHAAGGALEAAIDRLEPFGHRCRRRLIDPVDGALL